MKSRTALFQETLLLEDDIRCGRKMVLRRPEGEPERELEGLCGDLKRLRHIAESREEIEEYYLRFLARCRLLELGPYRIVGTIGAGWNGAVFRAVQQDGRGSSIAVKLLLLPRNPEEIFRFRQEADLLFAIKCPVIVGGLTRATPVPHAPVEWFAMELVQRPISLLAFAESNPVSKVISIFARICEGLTYAHDKGIVHRDLHFGNVLAAEGGEPKMLDFGSARYRDTRFTFRPVGNFLTCSPEQFFDPDRIDGKSDVFSIAMLLYTALTKEYPLQSTSFGELVKKLTTCEFPRVPDAPQGISDCISRALSQDSSARQTAQELAHELIEIAANA